MMIRHHTQFNKRVILLHVELSVMLHASCRLTESAQLLKTEKPIVLFDHRVFFQKYSLRKFKNITESCYGLNRT